MSNRWYDDGEPVAPEPFDSFDLLVIAANTTARSLKALASAADTLSRALKAHANLRAERAEWSREVIKEIESL